MPKKKATSYPNKRSAYETFLRSVKLYSLALNDMSARVDYERYWKHLTESDELFREIRVTYEPVDVEDDHFDICAEFSLSITLKGDESKILSITCAYRAHFHATAGCKKEVVDRFAKSEAKIIIWPYFRQFISDITGRMHIPPITIPMTLD